MRDAPEEPTYTITVIVERTDAPGSKFRAKLAQIPKQAAEGPNYYVAAAVKAFRHIVLSESE